jgi:hypothetical protein
MKRARIALLIAAVVGVFLVARFAGPPWTSSSRPTARSPARAVAPSARIAEELEASTSSSARSSVAPEQESSSKRAAAFTDASLLQKLRAIAEEQAAGDFVSLKRDLEDVLIDVSTPLQVLELMKADVLAQDVVASKGGLLVLSVAIKRYNAGDKILGVDGRAFLLTVLDALPEIKPPEQGLLIAEIVRARVNDRYVLDLSYLSKILELRARHPDQAQVFSALLTHIAEELSGGPEYEQFYSLFVNDTHDPVLVRISLSALLRAKGNTFLPLAEEMYARAKGDPALRSAITQAIATSAPVADAAKSLSRLADYSQAAEFDILGSRAGALEALGAQYTDLVAGHSSPLSRAMLVSGMHAEKESVMLGIATTDPDAQVRGQALLTLTLTRPASGDIVDTLIQAHDSRGDPRIGISTSTAVAAAGNILLHTDGAQRDRAQKFLTQVAYDASISDGERLAAVAKLKPLVPKGTFGDLTIGGKPVE